MHSIFPKRLALACLLSLGLTPLGGCDANAAKGRSAGGPGEAMENVLSWMANRKLDKIWDLLPGERKQQAVDALRQFGESFDPELYGRAIGMARNAVDTARTKQSILTEIIRANLNKAGAADGSDPAAMLRQLIDMAETIVHSKQLDNLEGLRSLDIGAFLAERGKTLLDSAESINQLMPTPSGYAPSPKSSDLKVIDELIDGDRGIVTLMTPERAAGKVEMVRIDGHWLPSPLLQEWDAYVGPVRAAIDSMPPMDAAAKSRLTFTLNEFDAVLKRAGEAESERELREALGPILGLIGAAPPQPGAAGPQAPGGG